MYKAINLLLLWGHLTLRKNKCYKTMYQFRMNFYFIHYRIYYESTKLIESRAGSMVNMISLRKRLMVRLISTSFIKRVVSIHLIPLID
jgi:hypothetical protein